MGTGYDPGAGMVASAFRFKSTIIPMVVEGKEFWFLLFFNTAVCIIRHMGLFRPKEYNAHLPWELTGTTGSLMTFFVVFYNSHVFNRYNKIYDLTRQMLEHSVRTAVMLRVHVPDERVRWKVAKWTITSVLMFFFERTADPEAESDREDTIIQWDQLATLDLLEAKEIDALRTHCRLLGEEAMPSFMVLQWSMELIRFSCPNPNDRDDMLSAFYASLYKVWNCQSQITETLELPMPFQYFHIMNMMLCLNLTFWAYSLGCEDSLFAPIIYLFVQMMFQGLRELSGALSDPFGEDEVDFPVNDWLRPMYVHVYSLLGSHTLNGKSDFNAADVDFELHNKKMPDPDVCKGDINMYIDEAAQKAEQERLLEKKRLKKLEKQRQKQAEEGRGQMSVFSILGSVSPRA